MLMIGRAILGSPKVLLIDEPTEGLAPSIVAHLKDVFGELSKKAALVIVEQNLPSGLRHLRQDLRHQGGTDRHGARGGIDQRRTSVKRYL